MPKYNFFSRRKDEGNIKAIVQKAILGDLDAQVQLGRHYENKANGYEKGAKNKDGGKAQSELEKNQREAAKYYQLAYEEYEKAGQQNYPPALYNQGRCLLIGRVKIRDPNRGIELINTSAVLGYQQAAFDLANIYQNGKHGVGKNLQKAREAIIEIANKGNNEAQLKIGRICEENWNLREAQMWYELAVESGMPTVKDQALKCLEQLASRVIPIQPGGLPRSPSLIMDEGLREVLIDYNEILFNVTEEGKKVSLGKGGFGNVYLATRCYSKVAVKTLNAMMRDDRNQLNAFINEMNVMRNLRHDNIVSLLGVAEKGSKLYMVMQYMCNGSLYNVLHKDSPLSWEQRYRFAKDIASGLTFLHSNNSHKLPILHRDLKSQNVLLDEKMAAKLTDFGLSKIEKLIATRRPMGTAGWVAPELFSDAAYSPKSDVYALGITFWEIASRKDPYEECKRDIEIMNKVMKGIRPEIPEDCPPAFKDLIEICWQQDPNARPTANGVVEYLIANQNAIINYGSMIPNPEPTYSTWSFEV